MKKVLFCIFNEKKKADDKKDVIDFKIKCNFCDRCDDCEKDHQKEKKKKDDQKELEKDLSAINYLAFLIEFMFILICNTAIWLRIGI